MTRSSIFNRKMEAAMETVRKILDLTRNPRFAEDEDHKYDDKFGLAEFVVNSAMAAQINALERMGLDNAKLSQVVEMVQKQKKSVTLRLVTEETCGFVKEREVEIENPTKVSTTIQETTKTGGSTESKERTVEHRVTTKVKEYHWKVGVTYRLVAFAGSDDQIDSVVLQTRTSSTTIITTGDKKSPFSAIKKKGPFDISLTWLLQNLGEENHACGFKINRSTDTCKTPRRNDDIEEALKYFVQFSRWCQKCARPFLRLERDVLGKNNPVVLEGSPTTTQSSLVELKADQLFVPVLPLMESQNDQDTGAGEDSENKGSALLSLGDVNLLLEEQRRTMDDGIAKLHESFPDPTDESKIVSSTEATLRLLWLHLDTISSQTNDGVDYIELMLHDQLVAAIGKEVQPHDFDEFMRFHNRKFLGPVYAPKPFCYAIRRPNHYPDGVLSIENTNNNGGDLDAVETIVRRIPADTAPPMLIPINAATCVEFTGDRYLHAWIQHRFASQPQDQPKLVARARQFSSFMLVVGTIAGPNKFDPKDAIILQNKDEVLIPLLLNELPTPKEFKDAISSLSPEQQRFAKSFRGMQLESSIFGVCVVQLKPQLEMLLDLPPDSLTKEIGLTQDLLSLFIDYQIPSDLLSFDGSADASVAAKVETVKGYVKRVQDVIDGAKKKQLEEEVKKADMRAEQAFQGYDAASRGGIVRDPFGRAPPPQAAPQFMSTQLGSASGSEIASLSAPPRRRMVEKKKDSYKRERKSMSRSISRAPPPQAAPQTKSTQLVDMKLESAPAPQTASFGKATDYNVEDILLLDSPNEDDDVADNAQAGNKRNVGTDNVVSENAGLDLTAIPNKLNSAFDRHDKDNALHTTIITTGPSWTRSRQENLLTEMKKTNLVKSDQKTEKNKAFDLLDALSRSGSLPISSGELHIVLGITHCFENTVMGTVIEDNLNPIEKMEHSTLLVASTILGVPTGDLVAGSKNRTAAISGSFPPPALHEVV